MGLFLKEIINLLRVGRPTYIWVEEPSINREPKMIGEQSTIEKPSIDRDTYDPGTEHWPSKYGQCLNTCKIANSIPRITHQT